MSRSDKKELNHSVRVSQIHLSSHLNAWILHPVSIFKVKADWRFSCRDDKNTFILIMMKNL